MIAPWSRALLAASRAVNLESVGARLRQIQAGQAGGGDLPAPVLPGFRPGPLNLSTLQAWPNLGLRRGSVRFQATLALCRNADGRLQLNPAGAVWQPGPAAETAGLRGSVHVHAAPRPEALARVDEALCRTLRGFLEES